MSTLTPSDSLADVIRTVPGSERTLESFGLDYCCGGARTLAAACQDAGLDPSTVLKVLQGAEAQPAPDWASMAPGALVDHLEATHHAYLHAELPRLSALADKVTGAHGTRHPELVAIQQAYETIRADLEPHLAKEERVLFPMIREQDRATAPPQFHCGSLQNPISVMLSEHDNVGELLVTLRRLTHDYEAPADGCASYQALFEGLAGLEADTHLHVHKENNVLFPAVVAREEALAVGSAQPSE
jgi:regulator of cell morphogenesis and NO signaling